MRIAVFGPFAGDGAPVVTTGRRSKPAPADLGDDGKVLWRNLTREFEFNSAELAILRQLACTTDELASIKAALRRTGPTVKGSTGQVRANPLLAELRNHRKLADQLILALGLPIDGETVGRRRSAQAKQAADSRWAKAKPKTRASARDLTGRDGRDGKTA
jgi:P27 family predicted phage terminase small subunit